MPTLATARPEPASPLEEFVQDYIEAVGGAWDEVEPQVYDLLIPSGPAASKLDADRQNLLRVAFDPEALPEHPSAQLASYGTPVIDRFLREALERGQRGQLYFVGLNLSPHDLASRVRRALSLPAKLEATLARVRALHAAQAVFWFQATFHSDQREHESLPMAFDLHYGRRVRQLDALLDFSRLAEGPVLPLPEARRLSLPVALPLVRAEALATLGPLINARERELRERLARQGNRMTRYYADLARELDDQEGRGVKDDEARGRLAQRREAVRREERLRLAELKQKNTLRVDLRVLQLLVIQQPKLWLRWTVAGAAEPLETVWDPLTEAVEAIPCPGCRTPGFAFEQTRQGRLLCPACAKSASPR